MPSTSVSTDAVPAADESALLVADWSGLGSAMASGGSLVTARDCSVGVVDAQPHNPRATQSVAAAIVVDLTEVLSAEQTDFMDV